MQEILEKSRLESLIKSKDALVVYFYNDACQPCVQLRPKIKELVEKSFPKMELYFVNSATSPGISTSYQVFSSPVILVFFEGREYIRKSKYVSVFELESEIRKYYNLMFD